MSVFNTFNNFNPDTIEDLDKKWTTMWANTSLMFNTNMLSQMLQKPKENLKEGLTDNNLIYDSLKAQNKKLVTVLQNEADVYSSDDQKVLYQTNQTDNLYYINLVFIYVYFALLIVVGYILIFNMNAFSIYMRVFIAALFILYPFIIQPIEYFLYNIYNYIYSIINGTVFVLR